MPTNQTRVQPGKVFLDWAAAERAKTDCSKALLACAGSLSPVPDEAEFVGLLAHRHFLLSFFLMNDTEWFTADLTVSELGSARTMAHVAEKNPTRLLSDLVPIAPDYKVHGFSLGAMKGRPILVAASAAAQTCLIDGYNRCCEILRNHQGFAAVPVYLGVCPNLGQWRWYQ